MMTDKQHPHQTFVYIGTYTKPLPHVAGRGQGIYRCHLDFSTGELTPLDHTPNIVNPSYLVADSKQRHLYAVQETNEGDNPAVFAFAIEPETGALSYLNQQPAHGGLPCHITTDRTGRFVLAANYGTGSVSVFPVLDNGQLNSATAVVQHKGSGANPDRQAGPHAHAVVFDPGNRYVFVPDLGLDQIMAYRFDQNRGTLIPHNPPFCRVHSGAGPRHLAFHPNGRYAFGINELDATLITFAYNEGILTPLQTVSTLPPDFDGERSGAACRVAPAGRFVYGANRGHDSIAIFAFDETTATLAPVGYEPTQGQTPRDFAIDPSGTFLLVANQDTDTVVTFRIDQQTGQLEHTGHVAHIPNPTCLEFAHRH
jgi:6-phosphogluconolactonase